MQLPAMYVNVLSTERLQASVDTQSVIITQRL